MQSPDERQHTIHVSAEDTFAVELSSNPTTGYTWHPDIDARYLELTEQGFELEGTAIGAGGHEVFRFRALEAGATQIVFAYRRPWGGSARDTRRFAVLIA